MPVGESECQGWGLGVKCIRIVPNQVSFPVPPQGNGQCFCKAHVCGQTCAACKDGFFGLDHADYFGCRSKRSHPGPQTSLLHPSSLAPAPQADPNYPSVVSLPKVGRDLPMGPKLEDCERAS